MGKLFLICIGDQGVQHGVYIILSVHVYWGLAGWPDLLNIHALPRSFIRPYLRISIQNIKLVKSVVESLKEQFQSQVCANRF